MHNLLETLVNLIGYVRNSPDDDPKEKPVLKIMFPNITDEKLKNLDEGKEVTDHIHDTFRSNNSHLDMAKE